MTIATAAIRQIEAHPDGTQRILLELDSGACDFTAGQYVSVRAPDGSTIPFTVASAPARLPQLELHYYPLAGSAAAAAMDTLLGTQQRLSLDGVGGDVAVGYPLQRPLTFIVAGTGAAQAQAIIEQLAVESTRDDRKAERAQSVALFWHVNTPDAMYCHERFEMFAQHPWCSYEPVINEVSTDDAASNWLGRRAVQITGADVILCGSPDFVYRMADAIVQLDLAPASVRADAFSYAPRSR